MKSKTKPATTIDKIQKYCTKHGVASARPTQNELWIFTDEATAGGPKTLAHRLFQETSKLVSVESICPANAGDRARMSTKTGPLTAGHSKGSSTKDSVKYPKMLQHFRYPVAELTDDRIESMLDATTENALYVIELVERHGHWLRERRNGD